MLQGLQMHRPALLDEPLNVRGEILDVYGAAWASSRYRRVVRGSTRSAGHQCPSFFLNRIKPRRKGGAGERPQPVVADVAELQLASTYSLTPERVKAYSMEGNSIHYEQEAAERAGFRAPLIGGGMGVHYLTASYGGAAPHAFNADVYFRRPIFGTNPLP